MKVVSAFMENRSARIAGILLIGAGTTLVLAGIYNTVRAQPVPLAFSTTTMMNSLWSHYKMDFLEPGTYRTLDPSRNNITTSEGQSYSMLRAVWVGDKETFDREWQWTKNNLHRPDDALFSWLFGQRADGTYGVITSEGGFNTASDADSDIALSLIFAYSRWQDPTYLVSARSIVSSIWDKEVIVIKGVPYLTAENLEKNSAESSALINPSYLSPASYKIFALVDPSHPWNALADSSYDLIGKTLRSPLDTKTSAGLPPDWIRINKKTGELTAAQGQGLSSNFGYDAIRTPFRLALDWQWFKDPRDYAVLQKMKFLSSEYRKNGNLQATYTHDGNAILDSAGKNTYGRESIATYGATLGYFIGTDSTLAKKIYERKLFSLFDPDTNTWTHPLSYYDANWAWFGMGLYNHYLSNLSASVPATQLAPQ